MKKLFKSIPYIIISILVGVTAVYAGNLIPPGSPSKSMKSLSDLYELINTGANTPSTDFITPATVSSTMYSIGDTYDLLSTKIGAIDGTKILTGTNIFGVDGSATEGVDLSNMFNGTCNNPTTCPLGTEFLGGSQLNGGIDDYNNNATPPVGRYETSWTICNIGNNYCGTGDIGANAKDEATGLIWSYKCKDIDCASWDTDDSGSWNYSWNNSRVNNNGKTAIELCSSHSGWLLPSQKQLMQAYIDGAYGNLEPQGGLTHSFYYFWSSGTSSINTAQALMVDLLKGTTTTNVKSGAQFIRCVR